MPYQVKALYKHIDQHRVAVLDSALCNFAQRGLKQWAGTVIFEAPFSSVAHRSSEGCMLPETGANFLAGAGSLLSVDI